MFRFIQYANTAKQLPKWLLVLDTVVDIGIGLGIGFAIWG